MIPFRHHSVIRIAVVPLLDRFHAITCKRMFGYHRHKGWRRHFNPVIYSSSHLRE